MSDHARQLRELADDLTGNYIDVGDDFYGPDTDWGWLRDVAEVLRSRPVSPEAWVEFHSLLADADLTCQQPVRRRAIDWLDDDNQPRMTWVEAPCCSCANCKLDELRTDPEAT